MLPDYSAGQSRPLLLTVEESAQMLGLGRTHTYGLVMGGQIQSVKIGRRRLVVTSSIEVYISRLLEEQS